MNPYDPPTEPPDNPHVGRNKIASLGGAFVIFVSGAVLWFFGGTWASVILLIVTVIFVAAWSYGASLRK